MSHEPEVKAVQRRAHAKAPKSSEMKAMVCRRLKAAGMAYQTNQRALAAQLGVDPRQLNGYYQGRNYPDEAFLVRFCTLTGCTMDWIFRGIVESGLPRATVIHITLAEPDLIVQEAAKGRAFGESDRQGELVIDGEARKAS